MQEINKVENHSNNVIEQNFTKEVEKTNFDSDNKLENK